MMAKKKKLNNWYEVVAAAEGSNPALNIYGPIVSTAWDESEVTAQGFISDLNAIEAEDIDLFINSPGGGVFAGMAIYNAIQRHDAKVHVHIDGLAASIASVIALAGDTIHMGDSSLFMIHNPHTFAQGDAKALRKQAATLDKVRDSMVAVYEANSNLTSEKLEALMDDETWMSADDAVDAGFIEEVFEGAQVAASIPEGMFHNIPETLGSVPNLPAATEEIPMPASKKSTPAQETQPVEIDVNAVASDATAQAKADEQARKNGIEAVFAKYPDQHELHLACIVDDSVSVADASAKLLDVLAEGVAPIGGQHIQVEDQRDRMRAGLVDGALIRAGLKKDEGTNEYRRFGMQDTARAVLEQNGIATGRMSTDQIIEAALTHSTGDFPIIYQNVMHKTLLGAFNLAPDTWSQFADRGDVSDFRAHNRYRTGSFADLAGLEENGELRNTTTGDAEKAQISASERGVIFNMSYKMVVDDDMGAFLSTAKNLGRAAKRSVENDVYAVLAANAALGDGTALFHADHGNLAGSGTAISVASLGAARAAMGRQMDPDSNDYLDIRPNVLLCPLELVDHANTVIQSETDISKTNSKNMNPIRNMVTVVGTPRLTGTGWYLFSSPSVVPTLEVAFLRGQSEPDVRLEESFSSRGVRMRVTYDYGVAAVEYRGGYKNAGA